MDHDLNDVCVAGVYRDATAAFAQAHTAKFFTTYVARPVIVGDTRLRCGAAIVLRRSTHGGWTWGTAVNARPRRAPSFRQARDRADRELLRAGWMLL